MSWNLKNNMCSLYMRVIEMKQENNITKQVYKAQKNREQADTLLRCYLPFIKAEIAKFLKKPPREGKDDEISVAMFAFHEVVLGYRSVRIDFLVCCNYNQLSFD